jgi:hypothetical protein
MFAKHSPVKIVKSGADGGQFFFKQFRRMFVFPTYRFLLDYLLGAFSHHDTYLPVCRRLGTALCASARQRAQN